MPRSTETKSTPAFLASPLKEGNKSIKAVCNIKHYVDPKKGAPGNQVRDLPCLSKPADLDLDKVNMDTGVKAYKLLNLFSNPDTFYTMLFEMYVTNLCNKFILNYYVKGL